MRLILGKIGSSAALSGILLDHRPNAAALHSPLPRSALPVPCSTASLYATQSITAAPSLTTRRYLNHFPRVRVSSIAAFLSSSVAQHPYFANIEQIFPLWESERERELRLLLLLRNLSLFDNLFLFQHALEKRKEQKIEPIFGIALRVAPWSLSPTSQNGSQISTDAAYFKDNVPNLVRCSIDTTITGSRFYAQRFSTVVEISRQDSQELELMSFIKSTFDELQGCHHCWLNRAAESKDFFRKDGVCLVLAVTSVDVPPALGCEPLVMLEKAKFLQQRYPWLHVFAFKSSSLSCFTTNQNDLLNVIMKEYITFPILLSNRTFPEIGNGACYILFKDFGSPSYHGRNTDIVILQKAIMDLNQQHNDNAAIIHRLKSTWTGQTKFVKEPYPCSVQSLLLLFPACISVDESGNRFFLSDSNHHRIIIFDGDGKILDSIGSSPGFEDGEFETAKLMRPAASYYDALEDCLFVLDSENHAVRRANMEKRVLETLYPTAKDNEKGGLWIWIMNKLRMKTEPGMKSEEFDSDLMFPWHLMKSKDGDLLVMNRSFDTLWILDLERGVISNVLKGSEKIMEICGQMIIERVSLLKSLPHDWLRQLAYSTHSLAGILYSGLLSSFIISGDQLVICDAVGQRVVTLDRETEVISSLHFSNFGVLGLPYWLSGSLEGAYALGNNYGEAYADHFQSFTLLPGRINIRVNVDIPSNTALVESLQEGCVWRQARGAAVEVSGMESIGASLEKVGVSQQWYDELDNLAFSTEPDISTEEENSTSDRHSEDDSVHIDCAVNTSPGTSEVIIFAALYLKLKSCSTTSGRAQEEKAAMIADVLKPERRGGRIEREAFIHLMSQSNRDLGELVFMKTLDVRIRLNTLDHRKSDNSKGIVLTDSTIELLNWKVIALHSLGATSPMLSRLSISRAGLSSDADLDRASPWNARLLIGCDCCNRIYGSS
ncbi:hypothetical protein Nepgr_027715 [Nepenthes gracilis]|uniref:NHL domain-containing protein n=1 Tax=Nepenthes gracilis TaxID=150966 RepID=A0AAD3Y1G5_NEPGR|nr:hypothetical protein Nepgr_027715 [Nepenthes gracilis]